VGSKIRTLAFAPLYVAGWAIVAGVVVACSLVKRDKQRQEKSGEDPPPGYITRVRGALVAPSETKSKKLLDNRAQPVTLQG